MPSNSNKRSLVAEQLLTIGLTDVWLKLDDKHLQHLKTAFIDWDKSSQQALVATELSMIEFMFFKVNKTIDEITRLRMRVAEFNKRFSRATDFREGEEHILALSAALGADDKTLRADKKAFKRWFDRDAIIDRFNSVLAGEQQKLAFYLDRLGAIYAHSISLQQAENIDKLWQRYALEELLLPLFVFNGDNRVRVSAFNCLAITLDQISQKDLDDLVGDASVQYIYRAALQRSQDILIQRRALSLLGRLSHSSLSIALTKRLNETPAGDDFFVRRHALYLVGKYHKKIPALESLILQAAKDPSSAVRQQVAINLLHFPAQQIKLVLTQLVIDDVESCVRGSSLLVLPTLVKQSNNFANMLALMVASFAKEESTFVLRVLLKIAVDCLPIISQAARQQWIKTLQPLIEYQLNHAKDHQVRRHSAQAKEWFWLYQSSQNLALYQSLYPNLEALNEGQCYRLSKDIKFHSELQLARVLSLLAQQGFGFSIEKKLTGQVIQKGERFRFRWWRFIYELKHPSTDKRQGHRHTTGRHFSGKIRIPSPILCELAETKVPGEPLFITSEDGWRPYLPLVDDILSALDQNASKQPYQIVTSEGVTQVELPKSLWRRLKAQASLTFGFEKYARRRNWHGPDSGEPRRYIQSIEELGFKIRFLPHQQDQADSSQDTSVTRFFPGLLPFEQAFSGEQLKDYFFSVYENTLFHLGIFLVAVSGYFFGRHIYLNKKMRQARRAIPLVIGGWGTRGKSGTERLKAALFNALGYSVVSKTSGCEAMFLHSTAFGKMREMFLFRPYDKATIWEQMNVVRLSAKLKCDVFLWECMGLTPSYVHVLQKDWMRDDISTITNTYPDHEDLQGPSGHEIPRVMNNFIPQSSRLITSEEKMLPILAESATKLNTQLTTVGWLEAGLLSRDILQRFPYEEHPYNIALVLAMAKELNIDEDFALKEMADKVIADLGVLKTYPLASVDQRRLEFVMGMSANEKFGSLGNWTRMQFDQHDLTKDADIWITTIINNRSDRVPRSRVFAAIIANDISADRHILIGDNLHGLKGYIKEAWSDNIASLNLFDGQPAVSAEQQLFKLAKRFRVPISQAEVQARFSAMLSGLELSSSQIKTMQACWDSPQKLSDDYAQVFVDNNWQSQLNDLLLAMQSNLALFNDYEALLNRIKQLQSQQEKQPQQSQQDQQAQQSQQDQQALQSDFNQIAWKWFESKLVLVENYYASGNQVIAQVVKQTPPGLKSRIMGMQNIKGTGLDFVYRWQAWESCYQTCQKVLDKDQNVAHEGLKVLSQFQEFGPLCEHKVLQTLDHIKDLSWTQHEEIQAEIVMIKSNLESSLKRLSTESGSVEKKAGWTSKLAQFLEAFLDAGDAVKRRKKANLIYQELQCQRISHERAALELQKLNKRQKGGWADEYLNRLTRK